jgi:protein-S-isoprenylcysteine O-methyltransferase Ste14
MAFSSVSAARIIYWLAAAAMTVALVMSLFNGTTWPRLVSSLALITGFFLMGLYPNNARPSWARNVILLMLGVAILLLVLRVTGQLV